MALPPVLRVWGIRPASENIGGDSSGCLDGAQHFRGWSPPPTLSPHPPHRWCDQGALTPLQGAQSQVQFLSNSKSQSAFLAGFLKSFFLPLHSVTAPLGPFEVWSPGEPQGILVWDPTLWRTFLGRPWTAQPAPTPLMTLVGQLTLSPSH